MVDAWAHLQSHMAGPVVSLLFKHVDIQSGRWSRFRCSGRCRHNRFGCDVNLHGLAYCRCTCARTSREVRAVANCPTGRRAADATKALNILTRHIHRRLAGFAVGVVRPVTNVNRRIENCSLRTLEDKRTHSATLEEHVASVRVW
jgi:hypothetical protein